MIAKSTAIKDGGGKSGGCAAKDCQRTGRYRGKSFLTAARRMRSKPGSSGARFVSLFMMTRMPTVPGVFFQSAMTSATAGSSGLTRLISANLSGWAFAPPPHSWRRMVHRKGGNIDRAVDAHFVHRSLRGIRALNERGISHPRGHGWQATQVRRLLARLAG
jgi:hypothetical protein